MDDDETFTTETARAAAAEGALDEWVARFLSSPGSDNADLADLLAERGSRWIGPVSLPLDQLHRLAGPPGAPVLEEVDEDDWRDDVEDLARRVDDGLEPPPVVAFYRAEHDHLVLEDGNHRVEALRRAGETETWAVVGFEDDETRDRFLERSDQA